MQHELLPVSRRAPGQDQAWALALAEAGARAAEQVILGGLSLKCLYIYSSTGMYGQAQGMREEDPSPPGSSANSGDGMGLKEEFAVVPTEKKHRPCGRRKGGLKGFSQLSSHLHGEGGFTGHRRMTDTSLPNRCFCVECLEALRQAQACGGRGQAAGALGAICVSPHALPTASCGAARTGCAPAGPSSPATRDSNVRKPGICPSLPNKALLSRASESLRLETQAALRFLPSPPSWLGISRA